jgi:chromosome segregation ATPase
VVTDGTRGWSAVVTPVVAGRIMLGIAIVGLLVSLLGTVLVRQLVVDIGTGVDQSLELTVAVLETVDESFVVAEDALVILTDGTRDAEGAVRSLSDSLGEGQVALEAATALTGEDIADALDQVEAALPAIQQAAATIDQTLTTLSSLPLGLSYDPARPLAATIGELREGLTGLPDELREQAAQIERTSEALTEATEGTVATADALADLDARLVDATALLGAYADQTAEASTLVQAQREVIATSTARTGILALVFGVVFAVGQFVPLYFGLALASGRLAVGATVEAVVVEEV